MAADLNALPDEILHYICDLLETIDKLRLACVCQRFRRILSSPLLNKKASFKHCWNIPYKVIQQYLEKNKQWVLHLDLQDCYWLKQAWLMNCLYKCTNLVSLDVSGCSVSQKNVVVLMERFNSLKHFGWAVDKKTIDDEEQPLKKLNLCFRKLSSLKLLFHQNERIPSGTNIYVILCKFLLSNLCLKYLELVFSMSGNYVSYPFHIVMEVFGNGREMVKSRCHPVEYITTCFPLNLSSTVILPFTNYMHHQTGLFKTTYWENAEMEELFDGTLQLKNLDISGTKMVEVSRQSICKLLSCQSMESINIGVRECSAEELLSICSPVLESINLKDSLSSLDSDMLVLENLLEKCPKLKHINLLNTHRVWHCTCGHSNEFIKTVSKFESLASLAVNPCCIRSNDNGKNDTFQKDSKADRSFTLATLVDSCTKITEFELIDSFFKSDISKQDNLSTFSLRLSSRTPTFTLSSTTLTSISHWKHLQKLTLAGFQVNGGDFFIKICEQCTELKSLSIAHLKGPSLSHSSNTVCLNKALTHCHALQDFRLEQPFFDITKNFLDALQSAKKLERICLMVNHGKLAVEEIEPWLNKCSKVIFVQMFCNVTLAMCKTLNKRLKTKYGPQRPGFIVGFFAYNIDTASRLPLLGDQSPRQHTPLVHLQEITTFASRVASTYKKR